MAEGNENTIVVSIQLDDGSVRQGFIRVQNQAKDTFGDIKKIAAGVFTGELLKSAFDSLKDSAKDLFKEAVNSAREAEKNVQALNVALGVSGRYTAEASQQFQALAESIQATTTYSDDTVLSLEKLAITYTKTNAQAMKLTEASVNLAAVTGQDVNGVMQQLSATLSGQAGRFARLFPELQNFTAGQLKAGAAVEYFNSRFAGAAAAQVNTFDGRMKQLANSFDDFLKGVGRMVTSSPTIIALIKFLGEQFGLLAGHLKKLEGVDVFKAPITSAINFARVLTQYVGPVIETIFNGVNTMAYAIETTLRGIIAAVANVAAYVTRVNPFSKGTALDKGLQEFADNANLALVNVAEKTREAFGALGQDFTGTAALDGLLEKMGAAAAAAQPLKESFKNLSGGAEELKLSVLTMGDVFKQVFGKDAHDEIVKFANDMDDTLKKTGVRAIQALSGGVAAGMAAIGKALIKGGNLFEAFGGAMLQAIGQALVTEGAARILQGLARIWASYGADATGYELVGIGSAMAVAGGAMAAIGSGGTSGVSADGGAAGAGVMSAGSFPSDQAQQPSTVVAKDESPKVSVQIHGDVLDSRESGLRIVELLNEAFNNHGARVST